MKRNLFILVFVSSMFGTGVAVSVAQDVSTPVPEATPVVTVEPTPAPVVSPAPDEGQTPSDLLSQLLAVLMEGTAIVKFAALIMVLTQFAKPIIVFVVGLTGNKIKIEGDAARYLALVVQVVVWALYAFAQNQGQADQFTTFANSLQGVLNSLIPILPAAIATNLAASSAYNYLNDKSVPGFHTPAPKAA